MPGGRLLIVAVLAVVLGLGAGAAGADPFTGAPAAPALEPLTGAPADAPPPAEVVRAQGPLAVVGRALLTFQREANRMTAQHMRAIRASETSGPLLVGVVLAFVYGVVHALGPGHGKVVVASYFLARDARIRRGFLMGLQIAVCHVLSAAVVVALADLALRRAFGGAPAEVAGVRLASYGLIALIGLAMTAQALRRSFLRRQGVAVSHACCGHPAHPDRHAHAGHGREVEQGALSLGVGLVPCTGAVLILLYALANDILFAGALLVVAIAAGMALTMGALGVLSIVARNVVAARVAGGGDSDGDGRTLAVVSDYGGALLITLIGAALFWSAW